MLYLCDTCILIDYLRGKLEVQQKLQQDREQDLGHVFHYLYGVNGWGFEQA